MKKKKPIKKKADKKTTTLQHLGYNAIGLVVTYFLLTGVILKQNDYEWVVDMLNENHAFISDNASLSLSERTTAKLGASYTFFDSIRVKTPETAVIYLPGQEAFFPKGKKSIFIGEPFNKMWAIRFLYPRKVVIPSEMKDGLYAKKITHVTIVNGVGTELLQYTLPFNLQYGILLRDSLQLKLD